MQIYHELERPRLSKNKIFFSKNIVHKPIPMVRLHWHDSYEILYVRRGCGVQQINSSKTEFKRGSVMIICPGDVHTTCATSQDGCEIDVLQFVGEYFGDREGALSELKSTVIDGAVGEMAELFDRIQSEKSTVGESLTLSGAVFSLCGALIEACDKNDAIGMRTEFFRAVSRFMTENSDLRLGNIARVFGYSPEHFSRRFHTEVGVSYKYYSERIKLKKSLYLLDGRVSLPEIAESLGYSDSSSFIRAFKRIYGVTPGAYKKAQK